MAVDTYRLLKEIDAAVNGKCVGYGIAIYRNGTLTNSTGDGYAVGPTPGVLASLVRKFDSTVRMSMGSMGKTISAAAIAKALVKKGIPVDAPIHDELEDLGWTFGPNTRKLTYRMVLSHTSGLMGFDPSLVNLRAQFKTGLPTLPAPFGYFNGNYDMTRLLVPILYGQTPPAPYHVVDSEFGKRHIDIVRKEVLAPCGVGHVDVVYTGPEPRTRYYPDPTDLSKYGVGNTLAQAHERVGAGWWVMSAREYAHFIDRLRHGALGADVWRLMTDSPGVGTNYRLGLWSAPVEGGTAYSHNGSVPEGSSSQWMAFPDGVTAVVCTNTGGTGLNLDSILVSAWAAARS